MGEVKLKPVPGTSGDNRYKRRIPVTNGFTSPEPRKHTHRSFTRLIFSIFRRKAIRMFNQ